MSRYGYCLGLLFPLAGFLALILGGWWSGLPILLGFGVIPVLDWVAGEDLSQKDSREWEALKKDRFFSWLLYAYVPLHVGLVLYGALRVGDSDLGVLEVAVLTLSTAVVTGGIGITAAHELLHRPTRLEGRLSELLLLFVNYMHFRIEHPMGHHAHVATPKDPASSRRGEGFYPFFKRSWFGSYQSALQIESQRVQKRYGRFWHPENRMILYALLPAALFFGIFFLVSLEGAVFYLAQAFLAQALLEVINYIEHYGLSREQRNGRYEPVTAHHSWEANQKVSNYLLFNLQRHPDHHLHALRPYQTLRHCPESPKLPYSYSTMALIALIPPLWFRIMDKRLDDLHRVEAEPIAGSTL